MSEDTLSKEEILHIAELARLELTDQETEKMQKDLSLILDYFDLLKKAKGKVEMKKHEGENVLRKDEALEKDSRIADILVAAAPDKKDSYIKVKQVL